MIFTIFNLLGGVGLFLLGMTLLTDGLKSFAGDRLRTALIRFTGNPAKALLSGAIITALVQSSSATTVAVIGFVSAGLLTFSQSLGLVIGASLGTTSTGWIVSVLGLKVSVSLYALPIIGVGVFLRLLANSRWRSFGMAMAGFGLIFIGIDTLQSGMKGLSETFDFTQIPYQGIKGRIFTVLFGLLMTIIMQSSSAAIATVLTALHTGSINFDQAALLTIGCAVGTTVTGALAAIGGSVSAKRTALAHVTFNLATGLIAILILPFLLWFLDYLQHQFALKPGAMSLAAFHTTFITVGVLIFYPFIGQLALFVEKILPEKRLSVTNHLDKSLLAIPSVALEATRRALRLTIFNIFTKVEQQFGKSDITDSKQVSNSNDLLNEINLIQQFFVQIPSVGEDVEISKMREDTLHGLDHALRLHSSLEDNIDVRKTLSYANIQESVEVCKELLKIVKAELADPDSDDYETVKKAEMMSLKLREIRTRTRPMILRESAAAGNDPAKALELLDIIRWIDRVGYHAWRICNYLIEVPKDFETQDKSYEDNQ